MHFALSKFIRVTEQNPARMPWNQTGRWYLWLIEHNYWIGDFCQPDLSLRCSMCRVGEDALVWP